MGPTHERPGITRRAALGVLAAAGASYALLGPRGAPRRSRDGRTVIEYWEKWTGDEARAMLEIVEAFNASQNEIEVRFVTMSGIDRKARLAIAAGSPPDVLGLWSYSLPSFADSGALTDLAALDGRYGSEHYARTVDPLLRHAGRRWAGVSTCGTVALYCNRAALDDAGYERPPATIDELDDCADSLTVRTTGGRIRRAGFLPMEPGWWHWFWGHAWGGRLYDPMMRRITAADPRNVEAYSWVQRHADRFGRDELNRLQSTFGNYASAEQGFLAGRVAMVLQGPWLAGTIAAYAPALDYVAAPIPVASPLYGIFPPMSILEADLLVVPRGAREPQAATRFIAFTQQQHIQERLARAHAKESPLARVSEEFLDTHPNRSVAVHQRLLRVDGAARTPPLPIWPEYRDEMNSAMERIWAGGDVTATLGAVESRVQAALDRAGERRRRHGVRL